MLESAGLFVLDPLSWFNSARVGDGTFLGGEESLFGFSLSWMSSRELCCGRGGGKRVRELCCGRGEERELGSFAVGWGGGGGRVRELWEGKERESGSCGRGRKDS